MSGSIFRVWGVRCLGTDFLPDESTFINLSNSVVGMGYEDFLPDGYEVDEDVDPDDADDEIIDAAWSDFDDAFDKAVKEAVEYKYGVKVNSIAGYEPATLYRYDIGHIAWPPAFGHLPGEAEVTLTINLDHMVEQDYQNKRAFLVAREEVIIAALKSKFGVYPTEICGFETIEEGEPATA